MGYKVLIPTAGTGSRLGDMTKYLNKSLISIGNKPAISLIIEMFPNDSEFVIPLGYKGELVKEFLELAYPSHKFYFSDVYPYEGYGSGLGLSILTCKDFLQEPFVFCSCDTLVKESIPTPDFNWMGYGERTNIQQYRTLFIKNNYVQEICEKGFKSNEDNKPYIGLAGIYDFKLFWQSMENDSVKAINQGESFGLKNIIDKKIKAYNFTWYDTGTVNELNKTREAYRIENAPNILEKANEAIWFLNSKVIKFSDDKKFIADRVQRAKLLNGFIPSLTGYTDHMYSYEYAQGRVLSEIVTRPIFCELLNFSKEFWQEHKLEAEDKEKFNESCMKFYRNKTFERVGLFYSNFNKEDGDELINGEKVPMLKDMLEQLDWKWLAGGLSGQFHGDYHFENIIYDEKEKRFLFLDWRQNFGDSLKTGDIYYDFAKLMHGLIICHELIAKNAYWINWDKDQIKYEFLRKQILVECERDFIRWLSDNGYDVKKVKIMTALVFLNIAALHHYPYGLLLYSLGKMMLFKDLE